MGKAIAASVLALTTIGLAAYAQERFPLSQFIDAMSLPLAYERECAGEFGTLDPRVLRTIKNRAMQQGYDPDSGDFKKLVELEVVKSIGFLRSERRRCLEVKIEFEALVRRRP
jgi:hypothetical protein